VLLRQRLPACRLQWLALVRLDVLLREQEGCRWRMSEGRHEELDLARAQRAAADGTKGKRRQAQCEAVAVGV